MKKIYNWRKASVLDSETDGFLSEVTKIHIVGVKLHGRDDITLIEGSNHGRIKAMLQYHIDNEIPIVMHNGICYDVPVFEKLLDIDLSELMVIDSLILSQYLNVDLQRHSLEHLASLHPTTTQKFFVDNEGWKDLDWDTAVKRVSSDVEINEFVWDDFKTRLIDMYSLAKERIDNGDVGGTRVSPDEEIYIDSLVGLSVDEHINRILTFLMFKTDVQRLQEKIGWHVDEEYLQENIEKLEALVEASAKKLESVMPPVAKYKKVKEPAKKFKKDGTLSVSGQNWENLLKEYKEGKDKKDKWGNELFRIDEVGYITVLDKYDPPNINSHSQVKDFLFMHGWKPETFEFKRDDAAFDAWIASKPQKGAHHSEWSAWKESRPADRAIPQVRVDGKDGKELCESVAALAKEVPEIECLEEYSVIKHRLDTLKGIRDRVKNGKVEASWHGMASTLRVKHRAPCVNLPAVSRKYAEPIRGCLIAQDGYVSCGSDLSSLESRVAHHFMITHDPEYVETMLADDYDPHLSTALSAELISKDDFDGYKNGTLSDEDKARVSASRQAGKSTNYACLPVDSTEVLTDKGWMKGTDVRIGDYVMAYNPETKENEMTKVTATHFYEDAYVEAVGNSDFMIESTLNHRWYGWRRAEMSGGKRVRVDCVKTTEEFNTEFNIINSAPYYGGKSDVTPEEASLIGWLLSDGYYRWSELGDGPSSSKGKKRGIVAGISQAEHMYQDQVIKSITDCGMSYATSLVRNNNTNEVYDFRLRAGQVRGFLDRVVGDRKQKHETDWVKWVLNLKEESLKAFVHSFYLGDGNVRGDGKSYMTFSQNEGNIADALVLAGYLLGFNTTYRGGDRKCKYIRFQKERPYTTCQRFRTFGDRNTDVFCLTTELGSFVIRQNGIITITGNCVYGATPPTIAKAAGVSEELGKKLYEGYWDLNWSVKAIAEEQVVVECSKGLQWLVNPVNGYMYNIRTEKDIFSTLAQGTGSYFFDCWVDKHLTKQKEKWGKCTQTAAFHKLIVELKPCELGET